jgi:type IV conjugative transfer system coupling protein TraD
MARAVGDFTFGGQLFEAYWNMFVSSLRPVLYVSATFGILGAIGHGYMTLLKDDFYYLIMRGFSALWNVTGLNPNKMIELKGYGDRIPVRMRNVELFQPMADAMDRWQYVLGLTAGWFVVGFGIAFLVYPQIAIHIAQKQRQRTNERGASITSADALRDMVASDNEARARAEQLEQERRARQNAKANEAGQRSAWDARLRASLDSYLAGVVNLFGLRERDAAQPAADAVMPAGTNEKGDQEAEPEKIETNVAAAPEQAGNKTQQQPMPYIPYSVAGFQFPWRHETTHFFAMGTTGAGKSTVLKDLLTQARTRGDRAVVFDLTGTFIEAFYDPTRDTILNPLDVRCPQWSIFNECSNRVELHTAARALIPSDGGRGDPFWIEAARLMFVEACQKLIEANKRSNEALYTEIMTSVLPNLHRRLQGTLAGPLTEPEAKRMAESVRAVLNANAHAIQLLPANGADFSIRRWVREDDGTGRILFIAAQTTHLETLRSLLTLWYDTAIHALMGMPASPDRLRLWFIFDELGALHRLPSLEDGMRTSRNFGGAFALGIHTIQQLWSVYGQHEGDTIASLGRTQLYLTQPDYRSADWCSAMIGKSEYRESERSTTVGVERLRDGVGWTQKTEYRPIALPEQIMRLPSLQGYIKFPQGYPTALIQIAYRAYPKQAEGFIAREDLGIVVGLEQPTQTESPPKQDDSEERAPKAETSPPPPEKVGKQGPNESRQADLFAAAPKSQHTESAAAPPTVKGVASKGRTETDKADEKPGGEQKAGSNPGPETKGKGSRSNTTAKEPKEAAAEAQADGPTLERRMGPEVDYPRDDLEMGAD